MKKNQISNKAFQISAAIFLVGCMSLPKPEKSDLEQARQILQGYSENIRNGNSDVAIQLLKDARNKITLDGKYDGGKGALFRDEARLTALIGHAEFNRGNISEASSRWQEAFGIQFKGLMNQNAIDIQNQKIIDAIGTGASQVSAKSAAQKSGQRTYDYTVFNTPVPIPQMVGVGMPDTTVLRFAVPVEAHPFENIVKLNNNNKSSCTATMVSPLVAISAAHCMSINGEPVDPKIISLKREDFFSAAPIKVAKYFTHQGENQGWDKARKNDWLILVAERAYDKSGPFIKVSEKIPDSVMNGSQKIMLAGYSSDMSKGFYLTLHFGCNFKVGQKADAGLYYSNCENAKGSSGAAVLTTTAPYKIIGIHTAQIVDPKDEFYSVETFTQAFVQTLEDVLRQTNQTAYEAIERQGSSNSIKNNGSPQIPSSVETLTKNDSVRIASGPSDAYGSLVSFKIKPNIVFIDNHTSNEVEVELRCAPDGTIVGRKILRSSGNESWNKAVLSAIDKTEVIPRDINGKVYSPLVIKFRSKE